MTCSPNASHFPHAGSTVDPAIARRIASMGIKISELPKHLRVAVRLWAVGLEPEQVAAVAETARAITEHERELANRKERAPKKGGAR